MTNRKPEVYGDIELSIQASKFHYSSPKVDGLELREYDLVEVAIGSEDKWATFPSLLGLSEEFDREFGGGRLEDGTIDPEACVVAAWVNWEFVNKLRFALWQRANERGEEVRIPQQMEV